MSQTLAEELSELSKLCSHRQQRTLTSDEYKTLGHDLHTLSLLCSDRTTLQNPSPACHNQPLGPIMTNVLNECLSEIRTVLHQHCREEWLTCLPSCLNPSLGLHHIKCHRHPSSVAAAKTEIPAAPVPRGTCSVCLSAASTYAMVPCGHLCMCTGCCDRLRQMPRGANCCPICRATSTQVLRIHDTGPPMDPEPTIPTAEPPADGHGAVWYSPVTIGSREFLRDTQGRVYAIEEPDVVVGYWTAEYSCEYACGFIGSFESCTRHEQECNFVGDIEESSHPVAAGEIGWEELE